MDQSFFTLFSLSNASINSQHCVQTKGRNPSQRTNPYSCKFFKKLEKIVFLFPALFSPNKPFHSAQEVSSKPKHYLLEPRTAQIVCLDSHRFAIFLTLDFNISCIVNVLGVFI